ncbi:MAG: amidohydrolase family protein [Thermoplasmata archaeon]|jgi:cytosine/adenosine deaminase-related metal-dependent hydrolase
MLVEGAILDRDGPRRAAVRLRDGRVVEVGQPGTVRRRGDERRIHGIVVPAPVNGHTHLGDSVSTREPPAGPVESLVGAPDGYKFRLLSERSPAEKTRAIRAALRRMRADGTSAVIDFREEGAPGIRLLRAAANGSGVRTLILGRPLRRPIDPVELSEVLAAGDGIGLSSARDEAPETREIVARACRLADKRFALHASEAVREAPESYLRPRPDLLVHLAEATPDDLHAVAAAKVSVVVCPRSNALFGRQPNLAGMEKEGIRMMLGTDNAMFHAPSIWRELEFAYVGTRLRGRPASAEFLARSVLVEPYRWLGAPDAASISAGSDAVPLVLRLPSDDPAYQVVTRTTEHLIVRPGGSGRKGPSR